jgi:hypothetical protein
MGNAQLAVYKGQDVYVGVISMLDMLKLKSSGSRPSKVLVSVSA